MSQKTYTSISNKHILSIWPAANDDGDVALMSFSTSLMDTSSMWKS